MFRLTRPLFQQVLKTSTGLTGLKVHPNPLPALVETYQATLARVSEIPQSSIYRQSVEALTQRKLKIVQNAKDDIAAAEEALDDGQIEEALDVAQDELSLVGKMIEWKAYVLFFNYINTTTHIDSVRWEPLEEKPQPGQWEYFGKTTQF